jgi:hypothetical protein
MPRKKLVIVEGYVFGGEDSDAHPEHPIYIPITPPPDSGLHPEHPIYFPVTPDNTLPGNQPGIDNTLPGDQPGISGPNDPRPTPPIYVPISPPDIGGDLPQVEQPIYWPVVIWGPNDPRPDNALPELPEGVLDEEERQKLYEFMVGNLPPAEGGGPEYVNPV